MDQKLKDFVSNQVSTYCDADPEILSNYVLALLNESKPTAEIKTSLKDQLQEFFEDETSDFIDRLYQFMDSNSKATTSTSTSTSITTSITTEASVVKQPEQQQPPSPQLTRAANFDNDEDEDDEEDGDRSFKHRRHRHEEEEKVEDGHRNKRRLSDQDDTDDQNKYRRSNIYRHPHRDDPKANDLPSGPASFGNRRGGGYQSRNSNYSHNNGRGNRRDFMSKPLCKDYNEKGYCVRGDLCPYEHGKDTIVYEEGTNSSVNVNNNSNNNSTSASKINPANPMMPMMPPVPPFFDMPNMFGKDAFSPENMAMMQSAMAALPPMNMPNPEELFKNMMQQQQQPQRFPYNNRGGGPMRRGRGGGMRGGRGGYGYNDRFNTNRQPRQHQGTTLVIDNIPPEHCQMTTINDYFKKFGSITNISLQPHKALVSFNTREEAEAAHQSPDAIFDNRFVKVYWQKDNTGDSSQTGGNSSTNTGGFRHANTNNEDGSASQQNDRQKSADTSAPSSHAHTNEPDPAMVAAKAAELQRLKDEKLKKRQEHMQGILELQKQKEQLLQRQIDQQKQLLAKLSDKSLTLPQKEELLTSLKKIAAEIDQSRSVPAPTAPAVSPAAPDNDSSDFLKEKLARLQAEAASLGISPDSANQPPPYSGGGGGYYGRGGARGAWQPRGGMVKRSLDNRPTKVLIKDIPQETNQDELKKYFEQFGQVVSFENAQDGAIAHYSQRFEAEKAMAFGPNFPTGKLALSWYTNNPSV